MPDNPADRALRYLRAADAAYAGPRWPDGQPARMDKTLQPNDFVNAQPQRLHRVTITGYDRDGRQVGASEHARVGLPGGRGWCGVCDRTYDAGFDIAHHFRTQHPGHFGAGVAQIALRMEPGDLNLSHRDDQ